MTKRKTKILAMTSAAILFCSTFGGGMPGTLAKQVKPKLSTGKTTIYVGKTKKLSIKKASSAKVTWNSKNKKIATVKKNGKLAAKITGKKAGKTTVYATVKVANKKYKLKCSVTVKNKVVVPSNDSQGTDNEPVVTSPVSTEGPVPTPPIQTPDVSEKPGETTKPSESSEPTATPTANPSTSPTTNPTASPTIKPTTSPTEEPAPKENLEVELSATSLMGTREVKGGPTYNTDGSMTVSLGKSYGGVAIYVKANQSSILAGNYTKMLINVSSDVDTPLCIGYYANGKSYGDGNVVLGYTSIGTAETTLSYDLSSIAGNMNGIHINYNTYNQANPVDPITLTIHSITLVADQRDITDATTNYSALSQIAAKYGFKMGTVVNSTTAGDTKYSGLMTYHFNSLTAANEMKAYSMLNQDLSKQNVAKGNDAPGLKFTNADKIMDLAVAKGVKVRGHALVWDSGMCDWFFREGYTSTGAYVTQNVAKARMKSYIEQVLKHFEENYPGVIYCWDVVNEAVGDSSTEYATGDSRHVRTKRSGNTNLFYDYVGSDYVELAFQYTRETLDAMSKVPDIELYYNDYNTFYEDKRCNLVTSINSYKSDGQGGYVKLCDGVGMQSYLGGFGSQGGCMDEGLITQVKTAISKYADLGLHVQATELAVRNYQSDEATMIKHGEFYEKLFQAYIDINTQRADKPLKAVAIWGIVDNPDMNTTDYSYKMNGPFCGLFDENLAVKPAFEKIYALMNQ